MEMALDVIYLTCAQVVETYSKTIACSGGGTIGEFNQQLLDDLLSTVCDDVLCPTFEDKLTHLVYAINRNHIFADGNKRLSVGAGALTEQTIGNGAWDMRLH